jgi:hypothetical protein
MLQLRNLILFNHDGDEKGTIRFFFTVQQCCGVRGRAVDADGSGASSFFILEFGSEIAANGRFRHNFVAVNAGPCNLRTISLSFYLCTVRIPLYSWKIFLKYGRTLSTGMTKTFAKVGTKNLIELKRIQQFIKLKGTVSRDGVSTKTIGAWFRLKQYAAY